MGLTAVVLNKDEPNLPRCLESLRRQRRLSELIVVDGGSSPAQLDTIKKIADRMIYGRGFGEARVRGILSSREDWVMSCDSDTLYPPHYSEVAENLLGKRCAWTGPIYPLEPNLGARTEVLSNTLPKGFSYEFNTILNRRIFKSLGLHRLPYMGVADIGYPVGVLMQPGWNRRLWVRTRLPTRYPAPLCKAVEIIPEIITTCLRSASRVR